MFGKKSEIFVIPLEQMVCVILIYEIKVFSTVATIPVTQYSRDGRWRNMMEFRNWP